MSEEDIQQTPASDATATAPAPAEGETPKPGTLAQGAETASKTAPADWPADWRAKFAGEDSKTLKQLERMQSPGDLFKSWKDAQSWIQERKDGKTSPLKAPAEEAALKQWREEMGIPAEPDAYKIDLGDGTVFGEDDKAVIDSFKKAAFSANLTSEQMSGVLKWYEQTQRAVEENTLLHDDAFQAEAEEMLRRDWGQEYKRNLNSIDNMMQGWPEGLAERFLSGRLADGRKVGDDPQLLRQLATLARELNPASTVLPSGVTNQPKAVADRLKEIRALMSGNSEAYWKDEAIQAEYRELLVAQDKMTSRGKAA
jgi:hypothetical protein